MKRMLLIAIVFGLTSMAATQSAHATPVTFAQFLTDPAITQNFQLVNNSSSATLQIVSGKESVEFQFQNDLGLPTTQIHATLSFSITTTIPVNPTNGTFFIQQFQSGSFKFTGSGNVGFNSVFNGTDLLSAALFGGRVTGASAATGGNYLASQDSGDTVVFSSDWLSFTNPQVHSQTASLSFSSLNPMIGQTGSFLTSFLATGTGTFSSDTGPTVPIIPQSTPTPEPATLAMSLIGVVTGLAALRHRRRI